MQQRKAVKHTNVWYLVAGHGELVVRVTPGMLIGETATGELNLFDRSCAHVQLHVEDDGGLTLTAVDGHQLVVAGGARCHRDEVAPNGRAQIALPNNVVHLNTDFADLRKTDDTVQIRAMRENEEAPPAQPFGDAPADEQLDETRPAQQDQEHHPVKQTEQARPPQQTEQSRPAQESADIRTEPQSDRMTEAPVGRLVEGLMANRPTASRAERRAPARAATTRSEGAASSRSGSGTRPAGTPSLLRDHLLPRQAAPPSVPKVPPAKEHPPEERPPEKHAPQTKSYRPAAVRAAMIGLAGVALALLYMALREDPPADKAVTVLADSAPQTELAELPATVAERPEPAPTGTRVAARVPPLRLPPSAANPPSPLTGAPTPAADTEPAQQPSGGEEPAAPPTEALPRPQPVATPAVEPVRQPDLERPPTPAVSSPAPNIDPAPDPQTRDRSPDPAFLSELEETGKALESQAAAMALQAELLTAELALQQGRLVSPPEANAYALYSRVLAQAPDSSEAQSGLASVRAKLINRAFAQLAGSQLEDARRSLTAAAETGANPVLIADLGTEVEYRQWLVAARDGRLDALYPGGRLVAVRQEAPKRPDSVAPGSEFSVEVQFTVTKRGEVREVAVLGTPEKDVARAVRRAVRNWRFQPIVYDGQALAARSSTRVTFAD